MGAPVNTFRTWLVLALPLGLPCCVQSGSNHPDAQTEILKKWTLSRCLSQVAAGTPAGDDAAKTAAAYLEMGNSGVDVYERLDELAKEYLTRTYTGSVKSAYDTMKCIDLFESEELDAMVKAPGGS